MKWSFLTMVAERKVQLRDTDDYPIRMGSEYIVEMNEGVGRGRKTSLIAFIQDESVAKGMTTKAYCSIWAEKYIAKRAFEDVILHLQNTGVVTHTMAKLDNSVALSPNFQTYSRLDNWSKKAPFSGLVPHDECEVVCAYFDRVAARQQEAWEDSYRPGEGSANMSVSKTEVDTLPDNPMCLIG